jgi:hypothetical protein
MLKQSNMRDTIVPKPEKGTPNARNCTVEVPNKVIATKDATIAKEEIAEIGFSELASNVLIAIGTNTNTVFLLFPANRGGRTISIK